LQTTSTTPASNRLMGAHRFFLLLAAAVLAAPPARAQNIGSASSQGSDPHAHQLLRAAVQTELSAAERDHSVWTYRDSDSTAERDALYQVVDSPAGGVRRMIELNGHPVDSATAQSETERISSFVHDPSAQARERKSVAHDDEQAAQMLRMLPNAFIWTLKSETGELATLEFRPNPDFKPPNMEARVMSTMAGEMVIAKADNRIRTLRGALTEDVKIGFGLLGKLRQGGTFDIERREIAPHIWQITESRVHIGGHALLFKNIGQQEDEIKSDWKPSTAKTLEEAAKQLGAG
jgi:hypothetical protein